MTKQIYVLSDSDIDRIEKSISWFHENSKSLKDFLGREMMASGSPEAENGVSITGILDGWVVKSEGELPPYILSNLLSKLVSHKAF